MRCTHLLPPLLILLSACGGGVEPVAETAPDAQALKSVAPPDLPNPLPRTPPSPDVLLRESFGLAAGWRPAGGKGEMRAVYPHVTLGGYWTEYLGSKANRWLTPDGDQTWKFASVGGYLDPHELPSPLQATPESQGVAFSEYFDAVTQYPTALVPFFSSSAYTVSIEALPAPIAGAYVALGLTGSTQLLSNLSSVGAVWLSLRHDPGGALRYELRLNGMSGALLAQGFTEDLTYNQLLLRYDPVAQRIDAQVNGQSLGSHRAAFAAPRYLGFEGVGMVDNLVVRR